MDKHRFNLFVPAPLWEQIKSLAARHHRSITNEIVVAIESHVIQSGSQSLPAGLENPPESRSE